MAEIQVEKSGNRCGHDKLKPFLLSLDPLFTSGGRFGSLSVNPKHGGDRPIDVAKIISALKSAYFKREILPTAFHSRPNIDGTPRRVRSDGYEPALALLSAALVHLDWASGRVGYYGADGFVSRSLAFLGYCANMPHSRFKLSADPTDNYNRAQTETFAHDRVKRSSRKLSQWGAWTLTRQYVEYQTTDKNGQPVTRTVAVPAVKQVNLTWLTQLPGISEKTIARLRSWSAERRKKLHQQLDREIQRRMSAAQKIEEARNIAPIPVRKSESLSTIRAQLQEQYIRKTGEPMTPRALLRAAAAKVAENRAANSAAKEEKPPPD